MILSFNGETREFDDDHIAVLYYPNDLMNGLFIDMDENYAFISAWGGNDDFIAEAVAQGAPEYELGDVEIDFTEPPHCWVMRSLIKLVVMSAEELS
jgi:hypothetical protein